ncbi:MAG: hypothetical protein NT058_01595 [Candidatus Portnoybacteria bacterium]|nr:hypothetical protein [Candidatus Portnoybacteria bacterium]
MFKIVVDFTKSLIEMIKAGKYDHVDPDITSEHFLANGLGRHELVPELVHYDKFVESEEILLGSVWRRSQPGYFCVAYLGGGVYGGGVSSRALDLICCESGWDDHYWFLAICK